jgi:hypothetical protein
MAGRITLYRVAGYVTNLTLGLSPYWQCQNGVLVADHASEFFFIEPIPVNRLA